LTPAEKLALCRRSYAAFSDRLDIDAVLLLYHPECEWRIGSMGAAFGTESFRGHDGLRAWVSALDEGFEDFVVEIDEAKITTGGDLLLRGHAAGRARTTGIELSISSYWQEIGFRDGLVARVGHLQEPPAGWDRASSLDLAAGE
jgi:ketosteroid isomerase-like protein